MSGTLKPVSHSFSPHIEKGDTTGVWICSKYPGFIEYQFEQWGGQKRYPVRRSIVFLDIQ